MSAGAEVAGALGAAAPDARADVAAARRLRELAAPRGIAGLRREIAALGGITGQRPGRIAARGYTQPAGVTNVSPAVFADAAGVGEALSEARP